MLPLLMNTNLIHFLKVRLTTKGEALGNVAEYDNHLLVSINTWNIFNVCID